tara:strand:+ start:262 stop:612 length:351 start_codon:yes stop_codon:yes gene_type:complete
MVQLAFRTPTRSQLEEKFWDYHISHPEVYEMLVRFAKEWRDRRGSHSIGGMKMLWERVRWEMALNPGPAATFKCNNNHPAFYARLLMEREPELAGLFQLRRQRVQSSIGPENGALP